MPRNLVPRFRTPSSPVGLGRNEAVAIPVAVEMADTDGRGNNTCPNTRADKGERLMKKDGRGEADTIRATVEERRREETVEERRRQRKCTLPNRNVHNGQGQKRGVFAQDVEGRPHIWKDVLIHACIYPHDARDDGKG